MNRRYSSSNMSPVCHNFVQNAWKKDFCSNCFKSREDHVKNENKVELKSFVPLSTKTTYKDNSKAPTSILRVQSKKKTKRFVKFPTEVSSVIGFGGDGWSDEDEFEMSEDVDDDEDPFPDTEEERELHKLTKINTDFNTVKENLLKDPQTEPKKSYTSLLLGKIQTDSEGKRKTLMVSVTPFGQENKSPSITSHIKKSNLITTKSSQIFSSSHKTNITVTSSTNVSKSSETKVECKESMSDIVCTEKSLLDEISETLEQNKITTKLRLQKPTVVDEKVKQEVLEKKEAESKKNGIVRNCPITKNQERPKVNLTSRVDLKYCKLSSENDSLDSAISTMSSTGADIATLNSDEESFCERSDTDNDSGNFNYNTTKKEELLQLQSESQIKTESLNPQSEMKNVGQLETKNSLFSFPTYPSKILDMPPIIPKSPSPDIFSAEASRELAGEPDGRADPDDSNEAPALPNSPIPTILDPRPSFLHDILDTDINSKPVIPEKPKVPLKPAVSIKPHKNTFLKQNSICAQTQLETLRCDAERFKEVSEIKEESVTVVKLTKQDSDNTLNKRKAPMPPTSPTDEAALSKYQRNINATLKSDAPVVREMEKRERASATNVKPVPDTSNRSEESQKPKSDVFPEPAPRRNISLSHDNLLLDDKRKGKLKFSLKKFLRLGSSKELEKREFTSAVLSKASSKSEEIYDIVPKPKPRLVIIHPSDLNGSGVEVLNPTEFTENNRRVSHDDISMYSGSNSINDFDLSSPKIVNKPPPPPRNLHDDSKNHNSNTEKPLRPPPPKSVALQKKQKSYTWTGTSGSKPKDNIYANLGEVRSAIVPRKPERTASMREREAQIQLPIKRNKILDDADDSDENTNNENIKIVQATNEAIIHNYDDVYNSEKYEKSSVEDNHDSGKSSDSDYEYVNHARSSSPECDSNIRSIEKNNNINEKLSYRKHIDEGDANGAFHRSSSIPYCGSETESEIYSPYSFYSNDIDGSVNGDFANEIKNTTSKLRVRKGRSVIHKNLEDNYGAVVIANHEALAQVLEQVQQSIIIQPALRALKACTNLRWNDFKVTKNQYVKSGMRFFVPAVWNSSSLGAVNVTLTLHAEQTAASQIYSQQSIRPRTLSLNAATEFCDLVPLNQFSDHEKNVVQATIAVLAPAQVDTIKSFGEYLYNGITEKDNSDTIHEATFMMLQLVNGLKYLQARGIEEIPKSLTSFIILRDGQVGSVLQGSTINLQNVGNEMSSIQAPKTNCYGRLCVLQGLTEDCSKSQEEELKSLCECAMQALDILLPSENLTYLLKDLLKNERAVSLNQVKSVLEFTLWGPSDVVQGVPLKERELTLQRWLDLERATVLHGLVRSRTNLNAFEQMHLMFLVASSAKAMCDASLLIEKANIPV